MEEEILQLEKRVAELTSWKEEKMRERLTYPLDYSSKNTLSKFSSLFNSPLINPTGRTFPTYLNVITDLTAYGIEVTLNDQKRVLLIMLNLKAFTADAASDVITDSSGNHNLDNGNGVAFTTEGVLPAGLNKTTVYYVINRTGTTFKVSISIGGSAVNITDAGSGNHFYGKL